MFLDLIDKLIVHLFTADVIMLVNNLNKLMASDAYNISFFDVGLIEKIKNSPYPFTFKIYLLPFISWFDYSILRELVKSSKIKEAIWLVRQFDSYIDYDQPITSCVPEFSHLIIPYKGEESEYTLLVTKHFNNRCNEIVMRDLLNIKKELTLHWKITHHALRLVAMHKTLSYFYWIIPSKLCSLINKRDQKLWNKGIMVMAILPDNCLTDESSPQIVGHKYDLLNFNTVDAAEVHINYIRMYIHIHIGWVYFTDWTMTYGRTRDFMAQRLVVINFKGSPVHLHPIVYRPTKPGGLMTYEPIGVVAVATLLSTLP